jgi:transposase
MFLADRGYDADWIRDLACQREASANVPPKLAADYPAFVKLASIRIWLRANESTP